MAQPKNKITSVMVKAKITATSVKQQGEFDSKTKTAYLKADPKNSRILKEFGLTEYGDEDKFFIIKFSSKAKAYNGPKDKEGHRLPVDLETPNFSIDDEPVLLNLTHSKHMGNDVKRISAVLYHKPGLFKEVSAANPFTDVFGDDYEDPFESYDESDNNDSVDITDEDLPF